MGELGDLTAVVNKGRADAIAMADILHYKRCQLPEIRQYALDKGLHVRAI